MISVKLKNFSQPVDEELTPDDFIAYAARVSNPSNQLNTDTAEKLLRYLLKHDHISPFEMVSACIEIEGPRDILRQILRHRSFSFQEFSQRYADPTKSFDFIIREARLQDLKNRQNSIALMYDESLEYDEDSLKLIQEWERRQTELINLVKKHYAWAIEQGIAKECARVILPEGLTMSRMYMHGTLRSWFHYIKLRSANGTQKEHMDIAKLCGIEIAKAFPTIMDILNKSEGE